MCVVVVFKMVCVSGCLECCFIEVVIFRILFLVRFFIIMILVILGWFCVSVLVLFKVIMFIDCSFCNVLLC